MQETALKPQAFLFAMQELKGAQMANLPIYPTPSQDKGFEDKLNSFSALLDVNLSAIRIYQTIDPECIEAFAIMHAIYAERLEQEFSHLNDFYLIEKEKGGENA